MRVAAGSLCSSEWHISSSWAHTPCEFAEHQVGLQILGSLHTIFRDPRLEVPLAVSTIREIEGISELPLLASTWEKIENAGLSNEQLATLLAAGSFIDAIDLLGSVSAAFDLAITAPNWLDAQGRVLRPTAVFSINDAIEIAKQRRVLQVSPVAIQDASELMRLAMIVGRDKKLPLSIDGEEKTLEEVGRDLNLTRERVRQLETKYRLKNNQIRRWPLPPVLQGIREALVEGEGQSIDSMDRKLRAIAPELGSRPFNVCLAVLHHFGHPVDLVIHDGCIREPSTIVELPITKAQIKQLSRDIAGPLGFVREEDVVVELANQCPGVSTENLSEVVRKCATISDLPDGYMFVRDPRRSTATGIMHRMLACENPLPIDVLREGIARRAKARSLDPPPPQRVLLAAVERMQDFYVDGDLVESLRPELPSPGTSIDWLWRRIQNSPFMCVHRSQLLQDARADGLSASSIGVYASFYEQFITLPSNCVGIVGRVPSPELIELARQQAALLRIDTNVKFSEHGGTSRFRITVGNAFLDTGTLHCKESVRRRMGENRPRLLAEGVHRGHIGITPNSNTLFGFTSGLTALGVLVGDTVDATFDYAENTVRLEFAPIDDL